MTHETFDATQRLGKRKLLQVRNKLPDSVFPAINPSMIARLIVPKRMKRPALSE
jgi:hypothetical protein